MGTLQTQAGVKHLLHITTLHIGTQEEGFLQEGKLLFSAVAW